MAERGRRSFRERLANEWRRLCRRFPFAWLGFAREYLAYRRLHRRAERALPLAWRDRDPQLQDRTEKVGFDRHYVYHTAWAARILARQRPQRHVDVSSSLYFTAIVSAFVPVEAYDYRRVHLDLEGVTTGQADACALPFPDASVRSLSCMHVVEHLGLGRYGDPLDPDADLRAMRELQRVLEPGGSLLFVVPVGRRRVAFNGNRVYAYEDVVAAFPDLRLEAFALVPDRARPRDFVPDATAELANAQAYGCGCFHFVRGD